MIGRKGLILIAAVSAFAFCGVVAAQAADKPVSGYYTKNTTAPLFDWTGFYIGGHAGYATNKFEGAGLSDTPEGAAVGIQGGYRYQFGNNIVAGLEADLSAGDVSGHTATVVTDQAKLWGSIRGTLGYSFLGFMPYGTVGWGWEKANIGVLGFTDSQTHSGLVYGAGIAAPMTNHLIAKVEWLRYNLGSEKYTIPLGSANVSSDQNFYRVALEYKF